MTPVRIELGVHLLEEFGVDASDTGAAFALMVACIFLGFICLSCTGWQATTDDWRSTHGLSIDIKKKLVVVVTCHIVTMSSKIEG
jgi:hypothetical protein